MPKTYFDADNEENRAFIGLCSLEPRLLKILDTIDRTEDPGGSYFCAEEAWRAHDIGEVSLIAQLMKLVGPRRTLRDGPPDLGGSDALETCRLVLTKRLPKCRNCSCKKAA